MKVNISEIKLFLESEKLEYDYYGDDNLEIDGICPVSALKPNAITWIKKIADYDISKVDSGLNLLVVVDRFSDGCAVESYNLIVCQEPKVVYFEILNRFFVARRGSSGIAPSAVVETKRVGENVSIGHRCYICADVTIGNNVTIYNNVSIECPTVIGDDCVIGSGTVIGTFGYGYYKIHENQIKKVPDFGGVIIGNRVEIGANTCIARGTLLNTEIENDVKIDNLCHIAHNAHIGARSYIIAQSMIAGSCKIEDDVYIAPGSLIMNQKTIGRNAFVGMGSVVIKDVEENKVVAGNPARVWRDNI